jgi:exopolysaccharide biosynthesis protein
VLAAEGTSRAELRKVARGETVRIVTRLTPHGKALRTVMGGWPRLVLHGKSVADSADKLEGTFPRFSGEKHPRTAVGFSRDSTKLYLVTVDGRSESASGVSLVELAGIMLNLGAYEAMNFDGGGSTAMIVDGKLVNSPSDKGGERAVGSGVLVVFEK